MFLCVALLTFLSFMESKSEENLRVVGPTALHAEVGKDLILPCSIQPATNAVDMKVEWFRLDAGDSLVHLYENKRDKTEKQDQDYKDRTSMFKEELKNGNASLKLHKLRVSDEGDYKCFVEFDESRYDDITLKVFVEKVGLPPVIHVKSYSNSGGINLECKSKNWNPKPEVFWMDGNGDILPAEETHVENDSEGFNVTRNITVNNTETSKIFCRVQQRDHMMETVVIISSQMIQTWRNLVISIIVFVSITAAEFILMSICFNQKRAAHRKLRKQEITIKDLQRDLETEKQYAEIQWNRVADEFKKKIKYKVDVTLDPDTASPKLLLTDDGKQVTHVDIKQDLPDNPERFDYAPCVLGKQSFSSGRFYFEVQVTEKTKWDLGVVIESVNRKGEVNINPENGYWVVVLRNKTEVSACLGPSVSITLKEKPETVGVFVDYEEGLVSFYDVKNMSHIYSFTDQTFNENLYPYFSPCNNNKGKNSAPLIITAVNL